VKRRKKRLGENMEKGVRKNPRSYRKKRYGRW